MLAAIRQECFSSSDKVCKLSEAIAEPVQGPEPTDGHASKQSVVRQGSGWPDGDALRRDLHSLREAPLQPGGGPSQSGPLQPVFFWGLDWSTMLLVVSMLTEGEPPSVKIATAVSTSLCATACRSYCKSCH